MESRTFTIPEIEGHNIYTVSWEMRNGEYEVEVFDNYIDAFMQYEHVKELDRRDVELTVKLLPLPKGKVN